MVFAWICLPELFVEKTTNTRQKLVLSLVGAYFRQIQFNASWRRVQIRAAPNEVSVSVEMRAQKQVVSGPSVKSNAISVVWGQRKMLLPMLSLMFFISSILETHAKIWNIHSYVLFCPLKSNSWTQKRCAFWSLQVYYNCALPFDNLTWLLCFSCRETALNFITWWFLIADNVKPMLLKLISYCIFLSF